MRIRSQLFVLTITAILPVAVFALFAVAQLAERERSNFKQQVSDQVISLTSAVDAELGNVIGVLETLATSRALDTGDIRTFYDQASRVASMQPGWNAVQLALPSGEQVAHTLKPLGSKLPRVKDTTSLDEVRHSGAPAVGNIVTGAFTNQYVVPVRVPVLRNGEIKYVVTASISPLAFSNLLKAEHVPGEWIAGIVDREGRYIARAPGGEGLVGQPAEKTYLQHIGRAEPSAFYTHTIDGQDVYGSFRRSRLGGWVIGVAMPEGALDEGARSATLTLGGGMLFTIAAALFLAWFLARRIAQPIVGLASATKSLARGDQVEVKLPPTSREVEELAAAFQDASAAVRTREAALREADRMKDEFLASLSHELRNPLAAIVSAGHVLRMARSRPEALEQATAVVERQSVQMSRLVDDLLDVSRVTMGKAHLRPEPIDLAEEAAKVIHTFDAAGRTRRHRLVKELRPAWVEADPARIEQVISNLLVNALKYTPEAGTVTLKVGREAENAVLQVADTGEGFDAELGARMFEVFVQGEQKLNRAQGGLGIGLALVKRLVELHGGTASAASPGPGKGSLFTVRLPAIAAPVHADVATPRAARDARARRILLVEDNDDARRVLLLALSLDGHNVYEAADGLAALEVAAKVKPEVAVIDIGLPGIDGYEVARTIRAADYGKNVCLIAISGYGQPADRKRALQAEFDAHLTKPVAPGQLEEVILKLAA